ncbi:MAG TPA: hypothetical protein VGS22_16130 [Thermoanaerobaculia bacterium]|jgi:Zn ribbon nucleic-acid-binding protein|nr:hypothetical protein [Thermoanaerobaculia bacterium]
MALWKKLFEKRVSSSTHSASGEPEADIDEQIDAASTVMGYRDEGWLKLVCDAAGQVVGFWLGRDPGKNLLPSFLKMAAVSEKLDEASYISISLGDYRVVTNTFDERGGHYVMIGPARAPGEQIAPLESVRWRKGEPNPKSDHVERFTEGVQGVRFTCPTCRLPNYCYNIAEDAGAMVQCGHCGNIAHVPAAYKNARTTSQLEIRGCSYVPIAEFGDWFFAHPYYSSSNAEDWGSYGLWAFCASCKHRFASTVLAIFPVASRAGGLMFNANSPASAKDMQGLLGGKCPACGNSDLLALMVEIPPSVREKIDRERRRRTSGA